LLSKAIKHNRLMLLPLESLSHIYTDIFYLYTWIEQGRPAAGINV